MPFDFANLNERHKSFNFLRGPYTNPCTWGTEHHCFQYPPQLEPADLEFENASTAPVSQTMRLSGPCSAIQLSPTLIIGVTVSDPWDENRLVQYWRGIEYERRRRMVWIGYYPHACRWALAGQTVCWFISKKWPTFHSVQPALDQHQGRVGDPDHLWKVLHYSRTVSQLVGRHRNLQFNHVRNCYLPRRSFDPSQDFC